MSLVSDNTDQSCKLQITGHSSVDGRDKCLKSRETAIADKWNLSRKLACQMDEYATNQELASGVRTRTLVSHCRIVVVLVLALAGLGSPGSDMLAAYGKVPDLLNFMDYPRQWVALRRLKHGALNVGADLLLIVVVIDRKSTRLNSSHGYIS